MSEEVPNEATLADTIARVRADPRAPVVAAIFVVVAALVVWLRLGSDTSPAAPAPAAAVSATSTTSQPMHLLVHVVGAVRSPGVVELEGGARVIDAVDVAGGATADADLGQLNLAAPISDGQRIAVPRIGETLPAPVDVGAGTTSEGPINLNTASAAQLETLPGIGPALADAILRERANGRFETVEDLRRVRGIGDARFEQLRDLVAV